MGVSLIVKNPTNCCKIKEILLLLKQWKISLRLEKHKQVTTSNCTADVTWVTMLATKCERLKASFFVTNSMVHIRKKMKNQNPGCVNCHTCECNLERDTNQKWPMGPTNPNPNMLVIATLFQLILNFLLPSCWEENIPPFNQWQNPVSKHHAGNV